jgi:hypothetical protein
LALRRRNVAKPAAASVLRVRRKRLCYLRLRAFEGVAGGGSSG